MANYDLSWPCSLLAKLAAHVSLLHYCLLTLDSRNPIPTYRVSSILGCVKEAIKEFTFLPIGLNSVNLTCKLVELGNIGFELPISSTWNAKNTKLRAI